MEIKFVLLVIEFQWLCNPYSFSYDTYVKLPTSNSIVFMAISNYDDDNNDDGYGNTKYMMLFIVLSHSHN